MSLLTARTPRLAIIAFVLVCLTVYGGYQIGKDMAQRDQAVAAAS